MTQFYSPMKLPPIFSHTLMLTIYLFVLLTVPAKALPDPDGKAADMSKPVQVFIIMGQSNTFEMGKVKGDKAGSLEYAVREKSLYPFMVDGRGNWIKRMDVVMCILREAVPLVSGYEYDYKVAEVKIEKVEKGKILENLVYVRYWSRAWKGIGLPPPGGQSYHPQPKKGDQCRFYLSKNSFDGWTDENQDGGYNVVYLNGVQPIK